MASKTLIWSIHFPSLVARSHFDYKWRVHRGFVNTYYWMWLVFQPNKRWTVKKWCDLGAAWDRSDCKRKEHLSKLCRKSKAKEELWMYMKTLRRSWCINMKVCRMNRNFEISPPLLTSRGLAQQNVAEISTIAVWKIDKHSPNVSLKKNFEEIRFHYFCTWKEMRPKKLTTFNRQKKRFNWNF